MSSDRLTNQLFEAINNDKIAIGLQCEELDIEEKKVFENILFILDMCARTIIT